MTLPEVCERHENCEDIMPNTMTTNTLKSTPAADDNVAASNGNVSSGVLVGEDDNHKAQQQQQKSVGEALKAVLKQAASQGRVTCSLGASVDLLSTHPDDVMLCVMPLLQHPDATATIQSTLIRAVCLEHNIRVLAVDCDVKLAKTVVCSASSQEEEEEQRAAAAKRISLMMMEDEDEEEEWDDNRNKVLKTPSRCSEDVGASSSTPLFFSACDNLAPIMGFPCVLVRYPADGTSKEDELVAEFCKEQLFGYAQQDPYIELPD